MINIGIYGASSQSGMTYFADLTDRGFKVIGYNRPTNHGRVISNAINTKRGVFLERPPNLNEEASRFVKLGDSCITHDLGLLIGESDIIILAIPSHYHLDAVIQLKNEGLLKTSIPLILSPSRTFSTPYIWRILGNSYPVVCFSTSPYSCKTTAPDSVFLKRRKRAFVASLEGKFCSETLKNLNVIFTQVAFTDVPALTSLNNIGAIFHPATYLMNFDEINYTIKKGTEFSFYIQGIAGRPDVASVLESIDQTRLKIADKLGIDTFGLSSNPRDEVWRKLTNGLRALENEHENEIDVLRRIRRQFVEYINSCVLSAQHWLDVTYGVERIPGETLGKAIGRTPTYQKNSLPQQRYIEEDIPTGLVPLESIAQRFNVDCKTTTMIIDLYNERFGCDIRKNGRNLKEFTTDFIINYLTRGIS